MIITGDTSRCAKNQGSARKFVWLVVVVVVCVFLDAILKSLTRGFAIRGK